MTVEIIKNKLVLFPSNTVEEYGLHAVLDQIASTSSDPKSIYGNFEVDTELILERDT